MACVARLTILPVIVSIRSEVNLFRMILTYRFYGRSDEI
jgi:hypothetical protein